MTSESVESEAQRILIVDDDPMGVRLLTTLLEMEGLMTLQLEDWTNPLSDVEKHHPSLVLVDVRLRRRSGFDLLSQIREHPDPDVARVPVVMMSALIFRGALVRLNTAPRLSSSSRT